MRRVVYDRFGDPSVLRIVEEPDPIPGPGEVLVAVHAAALNPKDVLVRKGKLRWLTGGSFPRGTGYDWAGEVLAIGPESAGVQLGDRLYGMLNGHAGGTVADRVLARVDASAHLPEGLSFEEAAAIPLAAQTALQALRDLGRVRPGSRVACLGASGGVGLFAIQLARALGAIVTASASAGNLPLLLEQGAHQVIDYRSGDPLAGGPYDMVFDVFGNRRFVEAEPALAERATYVTTVPSLAIVFDAARTIGRKQRARLVRVRSRHNDLVTLGWLVARGELRPIIDSIYPMEDIASAHARIETKRTRGKVIIRPG